MRFETTPRFDADYAVLPVEHRRLFRGMVSAFSGACDGYVQDPGGFRWPARLRVRRLVGAPRVWELTWSFASPDGRATFEFISDNVGVLVRWRRIGMHRVSSDP